MNFNNLTNCANHFDLMSDSRTVCLSGPTTATCSQACEEVPASPSTEQGCDSSATCSQACVEMAMSPITGFICDIGTSVGCTETCGFDMKFDKATSSACTETCETPVTSECSETCRIDGVSQIRKFSAPPQYQRASQSYQVAPTFLC